MISYNNYVLCWLATVDNDMQPNVSPKEMFLYDGKSNFYIANIASPKSEKNIFSNNKVCVSLIDIFKQVGTQLKGQASILKAGSDAFTNRVVEFEIKFGKKFTIHSIIHIVIDSKKDILAPSYQFCPEITSYDMIEDAFKSYHIKDIISTYEL